jgi:hypothetical protein
MVIDLNPLFHDIDKLVGQGFTHEEAALELYATRPWLFEGV